MVAWRAVAASLLVLIVAGCGAGSGNTAGMSSAGPSPIVLTDTSPGRLQIYVSVTMGGYDARTRDSTTIHIGFAVGTFIPVKFVGDERLTCGGSTVQLMSRDYFDADFRTDAIAGKAVSCIYVSGDKSATIDFDIPGKLAIVSPREHATVQRGEHTPVVYSANAGSHLWVGALSLMYKAFSEPDARATQTTVDTRKFGTGEGSISLRQDPDLKVRAPKFVSVTGRAQLMTMIAVTWV
jgi:hypothetical protein